LRKSNRPPKYVDTPKIDELTVDAFENDSVERLIAPVEKFGTVTNPEEIVLISRL